jgi:hypothetical protein
MPDDARINPHDTVASWVVSSHDTVSPAGLPELQLKVPAGIFLNPTTPWTGRLEQILHFIIFIFNRSDRFCGS